MVKFRLLWKCKDGSVAFHFWVGPNFVAQNQELTEWIKESGVEMGILKNFDWEHDDFQNYSREDIKKLRQTLDDFFMCYTRAELHDGALKRRIQMTQVLAIKDLPEFSQLVARNFFRDIDYPELGEKIKYPGGFVKVDIGDCGTRTRAPFIGEHNEAILKDEMNMSTEDMVNLKQRRII